MACSPSKSAPQFQQRFKAFFRVAGAICVVSGLLVLAGWVSDIRILESFVPGLAAMKANAAVAFILSGISLHLSQRDDCEQTPLHRYAARVCALVVTAIGLLTLGEYVLGKDFAIDQLLVRDWPASSGPFPPGRMPPITSLSFVAAGAGLLLLDVESKKGRRPTELLALLVSVSGLLGLLDITYDFSVSYTGMAPNGILMFWVLAGGLLGARPRGHLMGLLRGEGVGAVTARRLLPASILVPLVLGWLRVQGQRVGLFDMEFGTGAVVVVNIVTLAAVVLFTARNLDKTDTGRRRAEGELKRFFTLSLDMLCIAGFDGYLKRLNPAWERTLGFTPGELQAEPFLNLVHPDDMAATAGELRGLSAGLETTRFENRCRTKDGSYRWMLWNAAPYLGQQLIYAAARDITERKQVEEQLDELRRQNELILNSAGEGIYGVAPDGRCTFANPTAAGMVGWEVEDLVGGDLHAITHHTRPDGSPYREVECPVSLVLKDGEARRVNNEVFWRKDGSSFPVEYICTPIRENDHVAGVVVTFRDITERRSVEQMKDEFISVVGHELRTPLTSIRGALGLLTSGHLGQLPARSQRMLEVAVTNADRLVRLINDILDIERTESGQVSLRKQACDAADLIEQALEVMRPLAEKAGVVLLASPEAVCLEADPDGILQTLTNLLSNAMKFSPSGSTVSLTARRQGGEVLFQVKDQGRGIPPEKIERIFGRFQQVDASDSRQRGGTGLGLAICRSIVQRHGGRIWAESQMGVGSTFFFTLPVGQERQPEAPPSHNGEKPLVLVCDDDPLERDRARDLLERRGYRVTAVASGDEAIEQAAAQRPAAIVLDLMMPGMNGWETTVALKEREDTRNIPIIISSLLSPEESSQSPAHVTAWLRKPLEEGSLTQVLEMALQEQRPAVGDQ